MTKKDLLVRILIILLISALMVPAFIQRMENEGANKDVVFALNYNNAAMVLSEEEFENSLDENRRNGVNTVTVAEESINSLISAGVVTGIKYNVLCHKYDDESERIIARLKNDKRVHNDSYVLITKRPDCKEFLDKWIPSKFAQDEFVKFTTEENADVYLLYQATGNPWQISIGFDENKLEYAHSKGFDIALSMMLYEHAETEYAKLVEELIEKYDIKFLNLKEAYRGTEDKKKEERNAEAFCNLIKKKGLYLVLTETDTQLSNQKPIGYEKLIESANGKVLRSYETVDFDTKNVGPTSGEKRYHQILNSVVDRNIRFVCVNQLTNGGDNFGGKSKKTNEATAAVIEKLKSIGYNTEGFSTVFDYNVSRRVTSAGAAVIMIVMCLMMLEWIFEKKLVKIRLLAAIGAVCAVPFTYVAPMGIVLLYPTLFATIAPCFCVTAAMSFVRRMKESYSFIKLLLSTIVITLAMLLFCGAMQAALLSGLDYYLNSIIFRGIKLSLIVPIMYTALLYLLLFADGSKITMEKIFSVLNAKIKVYWVLIAGFVMAVGAIYLIRSGNVSKISGAENIMRNAITELMTARPRTKEFLVGWPALALFLYYSKNTTWKLPAWILSVGSSILFASVINSFCHVFTDESIIFMRVINGFVIGIVIGAVALLVNEIALRLIKKFILTGKK